MTYYNKTKGSLLSGKRSAMLHTTLKTSLAPIFARMYV